MPQKQPGFSLETISSPSSRAAVRTVLGRFHTCRWTLDACRSAMSHQTLSDETKAWENSKGLSQTWPHSFSHIWVLLVKQPFWTLHSTYKWVEGTIATPWDGHEPVATLFPRFSTARWRQLSLLRVTVIRRLLHVAYGPTLPNMKGHGLYFPYPPIKSNQYSDSQWDYLHKRIKTANVFGIASRSRKKNRKSKMPELASGNLT